MAWLLFPLIAGIAVAELAEPEPAVLPYILTVSGAALLVAMAVGVRRLRRRRRQANILFLSLASVAMMLLGLSLDLSEQQRTKVDWSSGKHLWCGVVTEPSHATQKTWRTAVMIGDDDSHRKVMLSIMKGVLEKMPQAGDVLEFRGKISRPYNFSPKNKKEKASGFDYAKWIERQGFSGQGFVAREARLVKDSVAQQLVAQLPWWNRLRIQAFSLRDRLAGKYKQLQLETEDAAVLAALTLGDKSQVTNEVRKPFTLTGASHVLALSGLHLSILVAFLLLLLRPMRLRHWSKWLMTVVTILLVWGFVVLTGCSVSIVRSALMLTLMLLLAMRGEGFASLNNVVVAAFVILCVSPRSLMDIGFQMSFLAVFFIIYFLPYYREWAEQHCPYRWRWLTDFLYITVIAQVATAPLAACIFGRVPLLFLLTNVLVIPCAYVLLVGALLFFLLSWWGVAAAALGWLLSHTVTFMTSSLEWMASLPLASVEVRPSPLATLFLYPLIFVLFAWLWFHRRIYLWWTVLMVGTVASCLLWGA